MTLQKLSLLAVLTLAISVETIQAAPPARRMQSPVSIAVPVAPLLPSVPVRDVVVIPATGQTLKQPDVALFPKMAMLQKFGNFFEQRPQITTRSLPR